MAIASVSNFAAGQSTRQECKKALAVIFCASNAKKKINIDKDIINDEDYLDNNMAEDNNLIINWENADIKLQNHEKNTEKFLDELFANAYKNDKLVQAIIDTKVNSIRKLSRKIRKQIKLSMGNLEIKNSRLYMQGKIYVPNNKNLRLYLL